MDTNKIRFRSASLQTDADGSATLTATFDGSVDGLAEFMSGLFGINEAAKEEAELQARMDDFKNSPTVYAGYLIAYKELEEEMQSEDEVIGVKLLVDRTRLFFDECNPSWDKGDINEVTAQRWMAMNNKTKDRE